MKAIVTFAAFLTLAVVAAPADAAFPFRRNVQVQRVVVRQQVVVQKVVQQQAVYAQPVVVQPFVQAYSQNVCYPQAQIVAPVYSQQVVGGSACFFAR